MITGGTAGGGSDAKSEEARLVGRVRRLIIEGG